MTITGIITAIIIGAIIGALARLILPGKQNIPIWLTIVVGIVARSSERPSPARSGSPPSPVASTGSNCWSSSSSPSSVSPWSSASTAAAATKAPDADPSRGRPIGRAHRSGAPRGETIALALRSRTLPEWLQPPVRAQYPATPGGLSVPHRSAKLRHIRRYRAWRKANRPKATNPNATAVSRNWPNGCSRIVRIEPSRPFACCASNVRAA